MARYEVLTQHIRKMCDAAQRLAQVAEEQMDNVTVTVPDDLVLDDTQRQRTHEAVLRQAAQLLRHAAAELDAEAQSCAGWRQV